MSFIHLHVYSAYSLLSSTATVEEIVKEAKMQGYPAIALTDRNVMYGTIAFYKECLKHAIKPIIGLTVDVESPISEEESFPLVLLAKNQRGFENLLKITSVVQTKSPQGIPFKWLKHYTNGLFAITPGLEGEIEGAILNEEHDQAKKLIQLFKKTFEKDSFYLSIQDHGITEEKTINSTIIHHAREESIPLAATNQVYYINKEDAFAQECLFSIKNGTKLQDEERQRLKTSEYSLKSTEEMVEIFTEVPEALENTLKIAEHCNVGIELYQKKLPKYPTEEGVSADSMLEKLCFEGLKERYSVPSNQQIKRMQYELSIIKKMKFSDYFLIVWDFMRFSREKGILTGPGRGSAAGSIVAFVLKITDVDPIKHHLLFERFLNPNRITMPDIDIDFPDHRREEVIQYVAKKYGELHVAQIITFGTMAAKAALRDVGRVFGFNPKELDQLSSYIPARVGIKLAEAYDESQKLREFIEESELHHRLFKTAQKLEGLPRHTSIHAAGVVISEQPLVQSIPIQAGHTDVYLTQYSMEYLEDIGLLKMDFLGLRNLSLMESILTAIQRKTGKNIDIRALPLDDEKTFELLGKGNTTGIFQLESDGMRKVLVQLKPTSFEDIVAVNALYRPGPMENIPLYIKRKHGIDEINYPHPDLEPILKTTYGVIIYQEQIIQIASSMAGFTLGEADLLRRAVGKKQKEVLDKERHHFVSGAIKNQYSEKTAHDIYDLIVRFANYGFNRSHAVAYSLIAYQLAYLKAQYPLYFMTCLLSSAIGNEGKLVQYIRELQLMELKLHSPSVNKSGYSFQVEKGAIRYSLSAIKGVGMNTIKEIVKVRQKKNFADLFDFCIRMSKKAVNRKTLEALVHSGSFDEFGQDRATLLASLDVAIEHAELVKPDDGSQFDLFADEDFHIKPKYMEVDPISIEQKLSFEKEVLGLFLSDHPITAYKQQLSSVGAKSLIHNKIDNKLAISGIYVTNIKKIRTKKGDSMAFLTVSDQSGEMEAVIFPTVYKKSGHLFHQGALLLIEGRIEDKSGKNQFIVRNAKDLTEIQVSNLSSDNPSTLYLRLEQRNQSKAQLQLLKSLVHQYKGNIKVVLYYEGLEKTRRLADEDRVDGSERCIDAFKKLLGVHNVIIK